MPTSSALETRCIAMEGLPKEALSQVASYFQALSEPTRLTLLNLLRGGERSVGELAQETGFTIANVSRHLALLAQRGLVLREGRGTSVYYRIADKSVYALCDLVCGNIAQQFERQARGRELFAPAAKRRRPAPTSAPTSASSAAASSPPASPAARGRR